LKEPFHLDALLRLKELPYQQKKWDEESKEWGRNGHREVPSQYAVYGCVGLTPTRGLPPLVSARAFIWK